VNLTTGCWLLITQPSAGSSIVIELPASKYARLVKCTVTVDVTPGLSTLESHRNAPVDALATIASVLTADGPSTTPPLDVNSVNCALLDVAALADGGVTTPCTTITTTEPSGILPLCNVTFNVDCPSSHALTPDMDTDDGDVKLTLGVLLSIVHPSPAGSAIRILPPRSTAPAVVNFTVADVTAPVRSDSVSKCNRPLKLPALVFSVATCVGPSVTRFARSRVVTVAFSDPITDGGVLTPATASTTLAPSSMSAPAVWINNVPFDPFTCAHVVILATTCELGLMNDTAGLLLLITQPLGKPLRGS
jgi:hypothetical protein